MISSCQGMAEISLQRQAMVTLAILFRAAYPFHNPSTATPTFSITQSVLRTPRAEAVRIAKLAVFQAVVGLTICAS
jgi:hypothetical protein